MADKIARFKQALRAKATSRSQQDEDELKTFDKELQKYKSVSTKESPKQDLKTDRISNKEVPDTHSKTNSSGKETLTKKRDTNASRKGALPNNTSAIRLSMHARSSKLIQRKDQPNKTNKNEIQEHKPEGKPLASNSTTPSSENHKSSDPNGKDKNADEDQSTNFFKDIATSIHKHILAAKSRPPNALTQKLVSNAESNNQVISRIVDNAKLQESTIEIDVRLSDEISQIANEVRILCKSETLAWKLSNPEEIKQEPPSLFDNTPTFTKTKLTSKFRIIRSPASDYTHSAPPEIESYCSLTSLPWDTDDSVFVDRPFSTKRRLSSYIDSPLRKIPKSNSNPEFFEAESPVAFFGNTHSQDSFSNLSHRKLFSDFM